jgi:hypothetical protein
LLLRGCGAAASSAEEPLEHVNGVPAARPTNHRLPAAERAP